MNEYPTLDMNDTLDAVNSMSGWLMLIGIVSIIGGGIAAISILGILVAWVPIWAGVLLVQAAQSASRLSAESDPEQIPRLLKKLKFYFMLQGWLLIISVVISIIAVLVGLYFGAPFLEQFEDMINRV